MLCGDQSPQPRACGGRATKRSPARPTPSTTPPPRHNDGPGRPARTWRGWSELVELRVETISAGPDREQTILAATARQNV